MHFQLPTFMGCYSKTIHNKEISYVNKDVYFGQGIDASG